MCFAHADGTKGVEGMQSDLPRRLAPVHRSSMPPLVVHARDASCGPLLWLAKVWPSCGPLLWRAKVWPSCGPLPATVTDEGVAFLWAATVAGEGVAFLWAATVAGEGVAFLWAATVAGEGVAFLFPPVWAATSQLNASTPYDVHVAHSPQTPYDVHVLRTTVEQKRSPRPTIYDTTAYRVS